MLLSTINFRKLGSNSIIDGKMVSGLIFRSGNFNYLNQADSKYLSDELRLKYYLDLRSNSEVKKNPPVNLIESGIKWVHFPIEDYDNEFKHILFPSPNDYANCYLSILDKGKVALFDFLTFLSIYENFPLVFGCYAGKDRTGVASILLLSLLGFNFEDILLDYMESSKYLINKINFFEQNWEKKNLSAHQYVERILAKRETLILFNNLVGSKYNGLNNYILSLGITNEQASLIKKNLLK